jgi:hypothetical protein
MLYKTIILELLQDQYPKLHERLARQRILLSTLNEKADALKRYHETRMEQLTLAKPDSDPALIESQARELALQDLRDDLPCESDPADEETFSFDAAMSFISNPTPPA